LYPEAVGSHAYPPLRFYYIFVTAIKSLAKLDGCEYSENGSCNELIGEQHMPLTILIDTNEDVWELVGEENIYVT
jgi:hypothetical protein